MKLRAYLLMLFTVAVWGTTFVVVKDALSDATPLAFNLVRMTLAFLVLSVAYRRHWRCLLYTSPSPRDGLLSRMPSSA